MFPPLQHDLGHHLSDPRFAAGGQAVHVGTKFLSDGWVVAILRIDDISSEAQAAWLGACICADVLTHLRYTNQEEVPPEAVDLEMGVPHGTVTWSLAVYVTLASKAEAAALQGFYASYASAAFEEE